MILVPLWARLAALLAFTLAVFGYGWTQGAAHAGKAWEARAVAEERQAQAEIARLAKKGSEVVLQYVDRVRVVEGATRTITKEIPKYVTAKADRECVVPAGFISVLNHDLQAGLYQPAAGTADAASGVALSAIAGWAVEARRRFELNASQCVALQDWARALK